MTDENTVTLEIATPPIQLEVNKHYRDVRGDVWFIASSKPDGVNEIYIANLIFHNDGMRHSPKYPLHRLYTKSGHRPGVLCMSTNNLITEVSDEEIAALTKAYAERQNSPKPGFFTRIKERKFEGLLMIGGTIAVASAAAYGIIHHIDKLKKS